MTPTYPSFSPSFVDGVVKAEMKIFNKRSDVQYYSIGVFDSEWEPIPFVSSYKLMKIDYLGHVKFDVYVRKQDVQRATYICSMSKLRGGNDKKPMVATRICSKFQQP
jgi:hypothetical protein